MTLEAEHLRCRGCGSVIPLDDQRRTCRPLGVDPTQVGYRYLAGTWGNCYTLHRAVSLDEPSWLEQFKADILRDAAAAILEGAPAYGQETRERLSGRHSAARTVRALADDGVKTHDWRDEEMGS